MDELYDGPFCILSIVDNRSYKRLFYQVLEHDPNQLDMLAFFERFQAVLQARQLTVHGITTDGSNLYPAALATVFPGVPHQICQFHILGRVHFPGSLARRTVIEEGNELFARNPRKSLSKVWPTNRSFLL